MPRLRFAILLIAAFVAFAGVMPARAEARKASAQETATIRDCVKQKGGTTDEQQCVGLVAMPCTDKAENQFTHAQAECFDLERGIWDGILNEAFKALRDDLEAPEQTKLREMQRAWIVSRDATCEFYWHKIQGTMAQPMSASCINSETARRALFLIGMRGL